jgi:multidrug efflux pump subunit AcrA (membrane-fusion protein)
VIQKGFILISTFLSLVLVGCDIISHPDPTPTPTTIPLDSSELPVLEGENVVASGEIVPARFVHLGFDQNGSVERVDFQEDQKVEQGQLLAQLENLENLESQVTAAELELLTSQQELDSLYEGNDMAQVAAFQKIVEANRIIGDTKFRLDYLNLPITFQNLDTKEAIELAKKNYEQARTNFEPFKFRSSSDPRRKELVDELERARSDFNSAMRMLELEADLLEAQVNLKESEQQYELLQDGPDPDKVALAQARIKNAEAQLAVALKALEGSKLTAPISGTLVSLDMYPGQTVLAGDQIITLADLSDLQVETTDLSERDVSQVAVGQDVSVYIEALDMDIPGKVIRVSPNANVIGGDVVYTVVIMLDKQPKGLRWGMTVEVEIETNTGD